METAHTRPAFALPPGSCDCHVHVFGSCDHPGLAADRLYTPGVAAVEDLLAHQQALGLERMVIVQPTPYGADNRCTLEAARSLRGRADRKSTRLNSSHTCPTLLPSSA